MDPLNTFEFKSAWWLRNRHLQSCWASLMARPKNLSLDWEVLTLPDGDFLDLSWSGPSDVPLVILLPGLEGSHQSPAIQQLLLAARALGWQVLVFHYRGCSGRMNHLPRTYNGGDTDDFAYLMFTLQQRFPQRRMYAAGVSLGGSILARYLAQYPLSPIQRAAIVSTPYHLGESVDYLSRFYHWRLLQTMKQKVRDKIALGQAMPVQAPVLSSLRTLRAFDHVITAPLFGYASADAYYSAESCRDSLAQIELPFLVLHALDDPFVPKNSVPQACHLGSQTILSLSQQGGHVGFIQGGLPWRPQYWMPATVLSFLQG